MPVERGIQSGRRKRLRRTHWLPQKTTMNKFVYATARRKNLGRARPVSEVPATGRLPGRRNIRRVGRSVVKKNTRPAAPADPQAHVKRVGHDVAGPHSHHICAVRTSGRPAFSLRTCTPRSDRCTVPFPTACRRSGRWSFSPLTCWPRSGLATFSLNVSGRREPIRIFTGGQPRKRMLELPVL